MSYRRTQHMTMNGLKTHANQRGLGQWWMVLTIGLMVGFIFGFILFLSRLPDDQYTLVETERGIEQIETADADQYAFYDRLSDNRSTVPNAEANDLPAFSRAASTTGRYGAAVNERPTAVAISDELRVGADVAPVEIAASLATTAAAAKRANPNTVQRPTAAQRPSTFKRTVDRPSTSFYLQAGAFTDGGDAQRLRSRLNRSGMDAFIKRVAIDGKQWHRVRIGPFYDQRDLGSAQTKLGRSGISYLVIKVQS